MRSNQERRLADIERAIDELAALAMTAYASDGQRRAGAAPGDEQLVTRLAEIWTLLADLDPEVARRLPVYQESRLAAAEALPGPAAAATTTAVAATRAAPAG